MKKRLFLVFILLFSSCQSLDMNDRETRQSFEDFLHLCVGIALVIAIGESYDHHHHHKYRRHRPSRSKYKP